MGGRFRIVKLAAAKLYIPEVQSNASWSIRVNLLVDTQAVRLAPLFVSTAAGSLRNTAKLVTSGEVTQ